MALTKTLHKENISYLPVRGLWYELDEFLRPRPVQNLLNTDFPSPEAMTQALNNRWAYQGFVGDILVSSVFLSINHASFTSDDLHKLEVFELAIMSEQGVSIEGRFATVDECLEAHYNVLKEISS